MLLTGLAWVYHKYSGKKKLPPKQVERKTFSPLILLGKG